MSRRRVAGVSIICMMAIISVLLFAFVHNTFALFTDTESAVNTVSMGSVTTTVEEEIEKGVKKNIGVTNSGTVPCYVRMMVTIPTIEGVTYEIAPEDGIEGWKYKEDGYWYCADIVKPGGSKTLYESITVTKKEDAILTDEEFKACGNVIIYAESVQSSNILNPDGGQSGADAAVAAFERLKPQE